MEHFFSENIGYCVFAAAASISVTVIAVTIVPNWHKITAALRGKPVS